jgi:sugar phosphate isomerase/epimerase
MPTRRDVLKSLGGAALASLAPLPLTAMAPQRRAGATALAGVGLQLYTLRNEMRRDPEATLTRIAELGYTEIEWWGDWNRTPAHLRDTLDRLGLRSPAAHVDPRSLEPERLAATLEQARTMGHEHLIVAWTPPNQRTPQQFKQLVKLLNEAGRQAASVGIRTGYHNHDFEFAPAEGGTLWELLLRETDPAVVDLELDCYWAFKAGHDPIALLRTQGHRITHLHVKDSAGAPAHTQVDVGAGVIDWKTLLAEGIARRVRHAFVEHDDPADAWATLSAGRKHLRDLGY